MMFGCTLESCLSGVRRVIDDMVSGVVMQAGVSQWSMVQR